MHLLWVTGLLGAWFVLCLPSVLAAQEHWSETAMAAKAAREACHYDEATALYFQALKEAESFGEDDPRLTATLRDLADCLTQHDKNYVLAEQLLKREQRILRRLGPDFRGLVAGMDLLGRVYYNQGKYKDAEQLYQDALKICPEVGGPTNRNWRQEMLAHLGQCYQGDCKYDLAEHYLKGALAAAQAKNAGAKSLYWPCRNLARLYYDMHRYDDSLFYLNHCLAVSGPNSYNFLQLGEIYAAQEKDKEALKYFRQAAVLARQDTNGADDLLQALYPSLAKQELALGNHAEAAAAASEALTMAKRRKETALVKEISDFLATNNRQIH